MENRAHSSGSSSTAMVKPVPQLQTNTAYILWFLCALGICGGQRFYSGRFVSGLLYLFTFGIFGFGQLLDLIFIPGMVEKRNIYLRGLYGYQGINSYGPQVMLVSDFVSQQSAMDAVSAKPVSPLHRLLRIAQEQGGTLSMAQVALYTELSPEEVQNLLKEAEKYGYAEICNDPHTGAIRYRFDV